MRSDPDSVLRYEKTLQLVRDMHAQGAEIFALISEDDAEIPQLTPHVIRIPEASEYLLPILEVIPLQLIAYFSAILRGIDVDNPRNLVKAVVQEYCREQPHLPLSNGRSITLAVCMRWNRLDFSARFAVKVAILISWHSCNLPEICCVTAGSCGGMHFGHGSDELRQLTVEFCDAGAVAARLRRAGHLFAFVWSEGDDRDSDVRLTSWLNMMEADAALSERFRKSWVLLLSELNSTPLFAEAGLPAHAGLLPEIVRRLSSRVLPTVREASDAGLLFTSIFSSPQAVARFSSMPEETFQRLVALLWPPEGFEAALRLQHDLRQALRLLATRVAGRGVTAAVRERGTTRDVHDSPFYRLIFATEMFVVKQKSDYARDKARVSGRDAILTEAMLWKESVRFAGRSWTTFISRWRTPASAPRWFMTCGASKRPSNGWSCSRRFLPRRTAPLKLRAPVPPRGSW